MICTGVSRRSLDMLLNVATVQPEPASIALVGVRTAAMAARRRRAI
jgi:hypothetical protein